MVVVNKIFFFLIFILVLLKLNIGNSSQILDYETEQFIQSIIKDIKKVNNINKQFNFKIIKNDSINAFVDENNTIYITSKLIESCKDYVALLSVLAHEIGHIDKNHIKQRKLKIKQTENINNLSNLSIIASSVISQNTDLLPVLSLSAANSAESFIVFSKDQEREADYYSLQTLKKLELYSDSIIELLKLIEKKSIEKGLTREENKVNSHPYFDERIEIINYLNEKNNSSFDINKNTKFKFIQSKFIGYNSNNKRLNELDNDYKKYASAILNAKNGDFSKSLKIINELIKKHQNNFFLLETKADILFSYGYIKEAIQFYKILNNKFPNNIYIQVRIFENTNYENLTKEELDNFFSDNLNLIKKFYNNKKIILMYIRLSELSNKNEWNSFLNYWIKKDDKKKLLIEDLNKFKETNDEDMLNLIELIYKDYK